MLPINCFYLLFCLPLHLSMALMMSIYGTYDSVYGTYGS